MNKRNAIKSVAACGLLAGATVLFSACSEKKVEFRGIDVTGAEYARDLPLTDHNGQPRKLSDYRGKAVVLYFGYTHCPDVCPTSMNELVEVKKLLGKDGERLQGLFVSVDPERDTPEVLKAYMGNFDPGFLALHTTPDKLALLDRVRAGAGEGVVFKRADAPYAAGRPNSGGDWLKHKLYKTLSAIVARQNDQRSIALELLAPDSSRINVGNVTIPANQPVPATGAVVEIRYLYAYDGGALYQPVYLGTRSDIEPAECLASQREFKAESGLSKAA